MLCHITIERKTTCPNRTVPAFVPGDQCSLYRPHVLVVSNDATVNATLASAWTATSSTSNDGTANLTVAGHNVNLNAASGANGWAVSNADNSTAVSLTGSLQLTWRDQGRLTANAQSQRKSRSSCAAKP